MTLHPDGLVRDAKGQVIPPGRGPYHDPNLQPHFDRQTRIAQGRMAQACRIDPKPYARATGINLNKYDDQDAAQWTRMWTNVVLRLSPEKMLELWNEVGRAMHGGVLSPSDNIEGDPYCIFVTAICHGSKERPHPEYRQTAVMKTGHRVDEAEGKKRAAYLQAQVQVNTCEVCKGAITIWQIDNTRMETFKSMPENKQPIMAGPIWGDR